MFFYLIGTCPNDRPSWHTELEPLFHLCELSIIWIAHEIILSPKSPESWHALLLPGFLVFDFNPAKKMVCHRMPHGRWKIEENCGLNLAFRFRSRTEGRSPSASGPLYSSSNSYNDASALGTTAELLDWAQRWVPRSLRTTRRNPTYHEQGSQLIQLYHLTHFTMLMVGDDGYDGDGCLSCHTSKSPLHSTISCPHSCPPSRPDNWLLQCLCSSEKRCKHSRTVSPLSLISGSCRSKYQTDLEDSVTWEVH